MISAVLHQRVGELKIFRDHHIDFPAGKLIKIFIRPVRIPLAENCHVNLPPGNLFLKLLLPPDNGNHRHIRVLAADQGDCLRGRPPGHRIDKADLDRFYGVCLVGQDFPVGLLLDSNHL